jgi:UDP-N-acetylmuramoyl-L-alanyl-D-glutamate--2,6-diaminopimelate ligase
MQMIAMLKSWCKNCKAKVKRFALQHMAEYRAKVVENSFQGLHLSIDQHELYTRMIGGFNAYNILAAYAVGLELGMDRLQLLTVLSELESPAGRFQHLRSASGVTAIVDYAHTPDALQNVLDTISEIRSGNEQVITIVGCGGDRDRSKRPVMASIAVTGSDRVVLTSDNPRSEEPEAILNEMKSGLDPTQLRKVLTIPDRSEAIRLAVELSGPGDIILVAGKGHEQYQEIKGERHPFDDFREVNNALRTKGK